MGNRAKLRRMFETWQRHNGHAAAWFETIRQLPGVQNGVMEHQLLPSRAAHRERDMRVPCQTEWDSFKA
jgi:hypothetical protein